MRDGMEVGFVRGWGVVTDDKVGVIEMRGE